MKPKPSPIVDAETFVRAWQTAENIEQVCHDTGLQRSTVCVRASRMRSKGVPLKNMYSGRSTLDIPSLADLARGLVRKHADEEVIQRERALRLKEEEGELTDEN
jgi:hypothetical protein